MDLGICEPENMRVLWQTERKHTSDKRYQKQNFSTSETQKIMKTKIGSTVLVNGHSEDVTVIHHRSTADGPRNVHPHEPIVLICY